MGITIMYIARRTGIVRGAAGLQWAADITKAVQASGSRTSLWVGGPGTMPGSVVWSTLIDSFADLVAFGDGLGQDAGYLAALGHAGEHVESIGADALVEIVHGELTSQAPIGSFLGAVNATVNPDRAIEAARWAVTVADAWAEAAGMGCVVTRLAAGPMDEMGWLARFDDAASVDAVNAKLAASEALGEVMAAGAGLFTNGVQLYARRMA